MMGPSIWQLLIVLVIILLLFGTKKLKNLGSDVGGALRGFKKAVKEGEQAKDEKIEESKQANVIEGEVTSSETEKDKEKEKV
ncbi:MAG TPA: Sec-independent protein translocase subunit TatA [Gammaproteobacteria bacterium]|nr:Sec-independent protein translocase subunit TatA [Gammaproteobacteria bacterium]